MNLNKLTRLPGKLLWAIVMEGVGTTRMIHIYARYGTGKLKLSPVHRHPSPEELQSAAEQLKDIPRSLLFLAVFLIPVPGFVGGYALVAVRAERHFGKKFKLLPSRFRHLLTSDKAA